MQDRSKIEKDRAAIFKWAEECLRMAQRHVRLGNVHGARAVLRKTESALADVSDLDALLALLPTEEPKEYPTCANCGVKGCPLTDHTPMVAF